MGTFTCRPSPQFRAGSHLTVSMQCFFSTHLVSFKWSDCSCSGSWWPIGDHRPWSDPPGVSPSVRVHSAESGSISCRDSNGISELYLIYSWIYKVKWAVLRYGNLAFFLKLLFFPIVKTTSEGKRGFHRLGAVWRSPYYSWTVFSGDPAGWVSGDSPVTGDCPMPQNQFPDQMIKSGPSQKWSFILCILRQ